MPRRWSNEFDRCRLTVVENNRFLPNAFRIKVYRCIENSAGITIEQIVGPGFPLSKVRHSVKCLFADGKIHIEGWEVVEPRTFNFRLIQANIPNMVLLKEVGKSQYKDGVRIELAVK